MATHTPHKSCRLCAEEFVGRSDKIFCSLNCKSNYARRLASVTIDATKHVDKILHRNRSILLEVLGKSGVQKKISRDILDEKKFNFTYHTHTHTNNQGKLVRYVYDFSWLIFSDQEVLVRRIHRKKSQKQDLSKL